jgi:hypothetical protein
VNGRKGQKEKTVEMKVVGRKKKRKGVRGKTEKWESRWRGGGGGGGTCGTELNQTQTVKYPPHGHVNVETMGDGQVKMGR